MEKTKMNNVEMNFKRAVLILKRGGKEISTETFSEAVRTVVQCTGVKNEDWLVEGEYTGNETAEQIAAEYAELNDAE